MNTPPPQMKYVETRQLPLSEIEAGERIRPCDDSWVAGLAESMAAVGQKTAIEVVESLRQKGRFELVAGGHRLAAAQRLGWETIRAEIKRFERGTPRAHADLLKRLHEIDENLIRHELSALDRAVFLGQRQEVYEALYPETRRGGTPGNQHTGQRRENDIVSFSQETAARLDLSERSVQRAVRIYKLLPPETRVRISGTPLARSQGDLYRLTRHSADQQNVILDRIEEHGETVSQASAWVEGTAVTAKPLHEVTLGRLQDAWRRGNKPGRVAFMQFLAEIGVVETYDEDQC